MTIRNSLYISGIKDTQNKSVIICSIVRDCAHNLKRNITTIEKIGSYFKDYKIVVFENNSIDKTKNILKDWATNNKNVFVQVTNYNESKYMSIPIPQGYNTSNCKRRIQKMADYRNLYMEYIDSNKLQSDYIIIVDLDIAKINIKGVISSFGAEQEWDVIASNCYSRSPKFRKRYHDTYALIEDGKEKIPQTENSINYNRYLWASIKCNMPFIRVFSAYGGLAIYKYNSIKGLRYSAIDNKFGGVEVLCEHVSLHKQLSINGHNKTYINPNMVIKYQDTLYTILKKIKEYIHL